MSTHMFFMENWRKLSHNYHQILLLNNSSDIIFISHQNISVTVVQWLGDKSLCVCFFFFVLRFYGPDNPMGSCRARSVYLTTRLLGRLSPLSG